MNNILTNVQQNICIIEINRPKNLNALNLDLLIDLNEKFDLIYSNKDIKAVILTGNGNKSFIAGADIQEMYKMNKIEAKEFADLGQKLTLKIENFKLPVIAAINGYAIGGGCEFAMACHIRYASETATFGQPEVGLGLIAGWGGTQRLPNLIGKGRAMELLLSGNIISANEASEIGLVNKVVKQSDLLNSVFSLAIKITSNSPKALASTISSINNIHKNNFINGLEFEKKLFSDLFETYDTKEGIKAFKEKRKPVFKNK